MLTSGTGGGTAGCVLANRLSASPSTRVLLVERGRVSDGWASRVPLFSSDFASDGTRTLVRPMQPQKELVGVRPPNAYSGVGLGGTSQINQMLYTRGLPAEYDAWEEEGGMEGWGWAEMRKYFLMSEKAVVAVEGVHNAGGEPPLRVVSAAGSRPCVSQVCGRTAPTLAFTSPVSSSESLPLPTHLRALSPPSFNARTADSTIEAAKSLNLPYIPDVNSPAHPPFGCADRKSVV